MLSTLKSHPRLFNPATVTLFLTALVVLIALLALGGDPLALARLGTRFSEGDPNGTEGYDGQFVYYIARDPNPARVAQFLDVPAYRYQRILLPRLARLLCLGNVQALPWVLALLGILAQAAGAWAVGELLAGWGASRWYALIYGLWAGCLLAVIVDLPEPLAYGLAAGALLARQRNKHFLSWLLLCLAIFAKEVTILFAAAMFLADVFDRRWWAALGVGLAAVLPFMLFQVWLWVVFGRPGIGSGGEMATPFEAIPFMGILRIGAYSLLYLLAMLFVFGPSIILPTLWGLWKSVKSWLAGERNVVVLALLLNSLAIVFMPFSTFRETGGLLRFACGLVLSVLLFAGRYRQRKILNYCVLWMVLNVFLLKN